MSANSATASTGVALKLDIAASDVALIQQGERWVDSLDIFLVQKTMKAFMRRLPGRRWGWHSETPTYQKLLREGIPFDQPIEKKQGIGSVRIVVVDENSGRMGR